MRHLLLILLLALAATNADATDGPRKSSEGTRDAIRKQRTDGKLERRAQESEVHLRGQTHPQVQLGKETRVPQVVLQAFDQIDVSISQSDEIILEKNASTLETEWYWLKNRNCYCEYDAATEQLVTISCAPFFEKKLEEHATEEVSVESAHREAEKWFRLTGNHGVVDDVPRKNDSAGFKVWIFKGYVYYEGYKDISNATSIYIDRNYGLLFTVRLRRSIPPEDTIIEISRDDALAIASDYFGKSAVIAADEVGLDVAVGDPVVVRIDAEVHANIDDIEFSPARTLLCYPASITTDTYSELVFIQCKTGQIMRKAYQE